MVGVTLANYCVKDKNIQNQLTACAYYIYFSKKKCLCANQYAMLISICVFTLNPATRRAICRCCGLQCTV